MANAAVSTPTDAAASRGRPRRLSRGGLGGHQPPRHHRALSVAAVLLPRPLHHRLQDFAVADGDRHAALHAGLQSCRRHWRLLRRSSGELSFDNYVWLTEDALYFNAYVSSVVIAGDLDLPGAAGRLSDRLRHGARAGVAAADAADAGHPAVLDLVPDPRLCLDRHPEAGGPAQPAAARHSASSTSRWSSSTPIPRSSSASSIPTCPS